MDALLKLLNANLIVAHTLCFLLVLFVLKKFLWKPVFTVFEERKKKVEAEMRAIEESRASAERLHAEIARAMEHIDETAEKRLKEVERAGEERSREIREKARQDAERIIDDARDELRFELVRSREALRGDVVDMVVKVTEQMIQEKLTFEQDRKIIEGLLTDLEKTDERQAHR